MLPSCHKYEERKRQISKKYIYIPQTRWIKHFIQQWMVNVNWGEKMPWQVLEALGFRSQLDLTFRNSILLQISSCIRWSSRTTGPFLLDYSRNFCIADLNWSIEERRGWERGRGGEREVGRKRERCQCQMKSTFAA